MKFAVVALLVALAMCAAGVAVADSESSTHVVNSPTGKIIITVHRGADGLAQVSEGTSQEGFGQSPALPPRGSEGSSEESSELSKLLESSEESSAEESSEESSGGRGQLSLEGLGLGAEPHSAKGYRSLSGDDEFGAAPPCVDNCEAGLDLPTGGLQGPVVASQGLGNLDTSSGFFPVRGTQVYAHNGVQSGETVIVPQSGIASGIASAIAGAPSTGAGEEMGTKYQSPETIKAQKLAALDKQEAREREAERQKVTSELQEHMQLLEKINNMGRELRYQYANIRRHHNMLRSAIAGNKMALDQMGGDNEWAGTDYDIEKATHEPDYQDLDEIAGLKPAANHPFVVSLLKRTNLLFDKEKNGLETEQRMTRSYARDFFGTDKIPLKDGDKAPVASTSPHLAKMKQLIAGMKELHIPLDRAAHAFPPRSLSDEAKELEAALKF